MKKKILCALVATLLSLTACGGSNDSTGTNVDSNQGNESNVSQEAGKENTTEEKEEIDTSIYSEKIELITEEGKKVLIYYDPTVVNCMTGEDWNGGTFIDLGEMLDIYVADAESAEGFVNNILSFMGGEIGKHEESSLADYTIHYFTVVEPETGVFYDKMWVIELDSNVVCNFRVLSSVEEGSQLEKELEAIKFVVENEDNGTSDTTATNVNQDENEGESSNSANAEVGIQTYEFPTDIRGKTGTITYNGDVIQVSNSEKINGADFDMHITEGNRTHTVGATLAVYQNMDVEIEHQEQKNWMETKAVTSQISEIKEAVVNEIPVQYYSCVYSMNGESELRHFACFIDFPTIDDYYEYIIKINIDNCKLEEELILSALENLLVDIEIRGVKPLGVGEVVIENDEFDEFAYYEEYLMTSGGKTVKIYFDKEVELTWNVDSEYPSEIYIRDINDDTYGFFVEDAASAEEYINKWLQWNTHDEIGTQEEIQLAGRTIHAYHFVDKETGDETISMGVIELASDVVFTFVYNHVHFGEPGFEAVLGAIRFIVE